MKKKKKRVRTSSRQMRRYLEMVPNSTRSQSDCILRYLQRRSDYWRPIINESDYRRQFPSFKLLILFARAQTYTHLIISASNYRRTCSDPHTTPMTMHVTTYVTMHVTTYVTKYVTTYVTTYVTM